MVLSKDLYAIVRAFRGQPERLRHLLLADPWIFKASWEFGEIPRDCFSGQSSAPIKASDLMRRECVFHMREEGYTLEDLARPEVRTFLDQGMRMHWKDGNPSLPINVGWMRDVCGDDVPTELAQTLVGHVVRCGLHVKFCDRDLVVVDVGNGGGNWDEEPFTLEGIRTLDYLYLSEACMVEIDAGPDTNLTRFYPTKDEDEEGLS